MLMKALGASVGSNVPVGAQVSLNVSFLGNAVHSSEGSEVVLSDGAKVSLYQ